MTSENIKSNLAGGDGERVAGAKDDGGPAFPTGFTDENGFVVDGMTLRDFFAAKAMQGMMAAPDERCYGDRPNKSHSIEEWQASLVAEIVEHAYRVSDAMLKARKA